VNDLKAISLQVFSFVITVSITGLAVPVT